MIANAQEAIERLRHKRTGEVLPTKTIARNTRLIYLDDEMIGLRFHDTIIAKYLRDHVLIDTRGRDNPQGWFTMTTWRRIEEWTPARTFSRNGLRHVLLDPASGGWSGPARLYAHGTRVSSDGSCEIPLDPAASDAIAAVKNDYPAKLKRYADRVVAEWVNWGSTPDCCAPAFHEGKGLSLHELSHVQSSFPAIPCDFEEAFVTPLREKGWHGDALCSQVAENFTRRLKESLIPLAIHQIAPEFPYPQLSRPER